MIQVQREGKEIFWVEEALVFQSTIVPMARGLTEDLLQQEGDGEGGYHVHGLVNEEYCRKGVGEGDGRRLYFMEEGEVPRRRELVQVI